MALGVFLVGLVVVNLIIGGRSSGSDRTEGDRGPEKNAVGSENSNEPQDGDGRN
jgi:hypothetical protein